MKEIKFKKDCNFNNKKYVVGDVIESSEVKSWTDVWSLNERGYIMPLTKKEFMELQKSVKKPLEGKSE